jgi:hypothetical protein
LGQKEKQKQEEKQEEKQKEKQKEYGSSDLVLCLSFAPFPPVAGQVRETLASWRPGG